MIDNRSTHLSYSFEDQIEQAKAWERSNNKKLVKISDWNVNRSDVEIPSILIHDAINQSLISITQYAETEILIQSCETIESHLRNGYNIKLDDSSKIHLFGNVTQAIFGVMYGLRETVKNPKALVVHPSYFTIQESASLFGMPVYEVWRKKNEAFKVNIKLLEEFRERYLINIIILTEPAYSTGSCMSDTEWNALVDYCRTHDIWLMVDMAFSGLSWTDSNKVWIDQHKLSRKNYSKLILIDSPSKRLFTNNIKIALVFADIEIVTHLRNFSDWYLGNITGLQISLATNLLKPSNRDYLEYICAENVSRAKANYNKLEGLFRKSNLVSLYRPDSGFHVVLFALNTMSNNIDAMATCFRLVTNYEVLAIPTNDFFFHPMDEFGIRLNLMTSGSWSNVISQIAQKGFPI